MPLPEIYGKIVRMILVWLLWAIALLFAGLYVVGHRLDPRMLRNGVFLTMSIGLAALTGIYWLALMIPDGDVILILLALALVVAALTLAVALIANGITMIRLEGKRLSNVLSLLAGLAIIALPVLLAFLFSVNSLDHPGLTVTARAVAALLLLVTAYFGVAFVSFAVYSVVYGKTPSSSRPTAIIVLGSGLLNGEVPPLLRSRLDKALALYRREKIAGHSPILVPSGGQGADEPRPEATAMAEYLLDHGAEAGDVHPETASRTTRENLLFSQKILNDVGVAGEYLVVTNNYHVLRAASLTRRVGLPARAVGSPTARYFLPSAFIREYVAIITQYKVFNALACLPLVAFIGALLWESLQAR